MTRTVPTSVSRRTADGQQPDALVRLQRAAGNRAVGRLVAASYPSTPVVQRESDGAATALTEGLSAQVQATETITYTPLAAGCMAVTVIHKEGGAAGVHLVMDTSMPSQWKHFLPKTGTVVTVYVDTEFIGQKDGWYFSAKAMAPKSALQLQGQSMVGWESTKEAAVAFFQKMFTTSDIRISTNTNPSHTAP